VNVKSGRDRLVSTLCRPTASTACYPGAMAVGPVPAEVLYAGNQGTHTMSAYAKPWTGAPTSVVTYPATDLVSDVALDTTRNLLWEANRDEAGAFACGSQSYNTTDNLGFSIPLASRQASTPSYGSCVSGVSQWDVFEGVVVISKFRN
jgi:hypothetical protein